METIHKYPVELHTTFTLDLPTGAKFLTVQTQRGTPQMWWRVPVPAVTTRTIRFYVCGTGLPMPETEPMTYLQYLGTWQEAGGALIWHLFREEDDLPFD